MAGGQDRLPADQDLASGSGAPTSGALRIERGRVLVDGAFTEATVDIAENGHIAGLDLDASYRLVTCLYEASGGSLDLKVSAGQFQSLIEDKQPVAPQGSPSTRRPIA